MNNRTRESPGSAHVDRETRPSRRARRTLRRDLAVTTALELAKMEGSGALTMRRLGDALQVDPTTLYRLFRDRDELLLAVYERIVEATMELLGPEDPSLPWDEALRHIAACIWEVNLQYPAVTVETFARTTGGRAERVGAERILVTVARAGLPRDQTALYYRAFIDAVMAMCGQAAALQVLDPAVREKDATAWTRIYARGTREQYPVTRAHIEELTSMSDREVSDAVVESIISAIKHAADSTQAP